MLQSCYGGYLSVMRWDFPIGGTVYVFQNAQSAIMIPLMPNYYTPCAQFMGTLDVTEGEIIVPSCDMRMMSDGMNLAIRAQQLKKDFRVLSYGDDRMNDNFGKEYGGKYKFVGVNEDQVYHEQTFNGFVVTVAFCLRTGNYCGIALNHRGRTDIFLPKLDDDNLNALMAIPEHPETFLHLPYMRPSFGGYSAADLMCEKMEKLYAVGKKWKGRIVGYGFTNHEEIHYMHRTTPHSGIRAPGLLNGAVTQ